ncbi:hypothetical protein [Chitinophaga defluvii]|uniref:Uncharacterized protein n=1 Tax=Chitinophaga defluvii TaxID=3163343 RepID=A0ABV2T5Q1_9BACT
MEPFILDFDLEGKNYLVQVTELQLNGITQFVAEVNADRKVVYTLQKNGTLQPDGDKIRDVPLLNAIATRILELKNAVERNG